MAKLLISPEDIPPESPPLEKVRPRRIWPARPTGGQILVSVLIAALGFLASKALVIVDKDLRSMYTEYTLAATNLAHTASDLLRYRITITRAIEAENQKEFEKVSASLPSQRGRILTAVDQYAQASRPVIRPGSRGDQDLQGFRRSLQTYFEAADQTMVYLVRLWNTANPNESAIVRRQAELHAAENAGPKLVEASDALERLLLGVAELGKEMREEGSSAIRMTSLALVLGSLLIAALNILKV